MGEYFASLGLLRLVGVACTSMQVLSVAPIVSRAAIAAGTYRSPAFGYVVRLPRTFRYVVADAPRSAGFRAELPQDQSVWMVALPADGITLDSTVALARAGHSKCREIALTPARLSGLVAQDLSFSCPGANGQERFTRAISAIASARRLGRIEYIIGMEGPAPPDRRAVAAFETIAHGFRRERSQ